MYSLLCSLSFMKQEVQCVKGLRDAKVTIGLSGRKHLTHDICKLKEYILLYACIGELLEIIA